MKQQARIRLKTTSLLNIPSNPPPLHPGETPLQLQRVPSGNEMHLFILIPPQHFRCTINAQQATQWGMEADSHTQIYMHVRVCECATCVCGQVKGNRWSLFAHKGTKTINANDDDDVEQDNARSYLPPPCGSISLLLLLLLLMTPRGGQRMNNKPPQTWNALKIHNFQIIFNDFKYTWVEPVAPRQMDHEQRPEA